jgi:hypothetical protein
LALFIEFTRTWTGIGGDHDGETRWASNLARLAKANGIEIKGPYKFHRNNEGVLDCEEDSDYEDAPKVKRNKVKLSHGTWGTPYIAVVDSDDDDLKDNGDYTLKGWKALVCPLETYPYMHYETNYAVVQGLRKSALSRRQARRLKV